MHLTAKRDDTVMAEKTVRRLDEYNRWRLEPGVIAPIDDSEELALQRLERAFLEQERLLVRERALAAPTEPDRFAAWFEALRADGPGQGDPLFPWLETEASLEQIIWFLRQEVAGEVGFDDLVALTQIKLAPRAKLELARNYWDEMGQGHPGAMHGPMLARLSMELGIGHPTGASVVWESLALANIMMGLAVNRRYAYQSVGALGVIELTAPGRARCVNAGLKRVGVGGEARRYFALHATLDVKHSEAWNREAIGPLVAQRPEAAVAMAEGALMRLSAGARCFARYRRHFALANETAASLRMAV